MLQGPKTTDIRVIEASAFFAEERPRAAFSFGAAVAGTLTLCHVRVLVENRRGEVAAGWGAIFLSYPWAFPAAGIEAAAKDRAMRRLVELACARVIGNDHAHPIDLFWDFQNDLADLAAQAGCDVGTNQPPPPLAALVCAAPLDAAIHDAFGWCNAIPTYDGYGPEHCRHDLSRYLGERFRGRYVEESLRRAPLPRVPVAHTVGGLDPLTAADVPPDLPDDGRPRSLDRWVAREGLRAFKVKLHGTDIEHDLDRLTTVRRVAQEAALEPHREIHLSVDMNEQCPSADYPLEYLGRLQAEAPATFAALRYVEQPVARGFGPAAPDLAAVSALVPVMLDEGLTSIDDLRRAAELGWTAVALKTCKCQSLMLPALALAEELGMMVTVQDLSNPGLALLQSLGLAARLRAPSPMEANARQFFPDASASEEAALPAAFRVRDGALVTVPLQGDGFGYGVDRINRAIFREAIPV